MVTGGRKIGKRWQHFHVGLLILPVLLLMQVTLVMAGEAAEAAGETGADWLEAVTEAEAVVGDEFIMGDEIAIGEKDAVAEDLIFDDEDVFEDGFSSRMRLSRKISLMNHWSGKKTFSRDSKKMPETRLSR